MLKELDNSIATTASSVTSTGDYTTGTKIVITFSDESAVNTAFDISV